MLTRAVRISRNFISAPGKAAWLDDRLAWKVFEYRQRRQDTINRAFDATHGTDTAGELSLTAAGVGAVEAARGNLVYRPLWENNFHATMRTLQAQLAGGLDQFTFVDIGSGKGKLLLLAAAYPFRKVIGIEYAPALHAIAERNVARFLTSPARCRDVTPVLGDALATTLPEGPVVAMIFNAFDQPTTAAVVAHLMRQRPDGTGAAVIIYENVRRVEEIGTAMATTAPWVTLQRTRNRIVIGNSDAAKLWRQPGRSATVTPARVKGDAAVTDVAVVGAGPYGLSMAAHLAARGVDHRVFGTPMQFWAETMPPGMALKTSWATAGFSDPVKPYSLIDYCRERGLPHDESGPISLETFVAYGREFQRRSVPHLTQTHVVRIARDGAGFRLETSDGAIISARRVVLATGIGEHRFVPDELAALPAALMSHSATCGSFERFRDKDVVVVGGGASAIDTAAALRQFGARGVVVARRDAVRYQSPGSNRRTLLEQLRAPDSKLGPGWRALAVTTLPGVFNRLPEPFRVEIVRRFLGPAASWPARLIVEGHVPFRLGAHIETVSVVDNRVAVGLRFRDGRRETLHADHVIAATGYRVDMGRYDLLDADIRASLRLADASPVLSPRFETSVPGLYVTGTAAAVSFGPMFRFVCGAGYTARRIAGHVAPNTVGERVAYAVGTLAARVSRGAPGAPAATETPRP